MEVILLKDVQNLGYTNDKVTVKDGYGRNFLIPKGLAVVANKSNIKVMQNRQKHVNAKIDALRDSYQQIKDTLEGSTVKVGAKVGGDGEKIFGSITTLQIADAIKDQKKIEIDRRVITLNADVKALGSYPASVRLAEDMSFDINVEVVGE